MPDPLRHTTLRQLQIFLAAVEHSSFARAAEILHLTPPAVSMQMSQMAESIGMGLFEKRGRKLMLTQAGETLLPPYAERMAQTPREASDATWTSRSWVPLSTRFQAGFPGAFHLTVNL